MFPTSGPLLNWSFRKDLSNVPDGQRSIGVDVYTFQTPSSLGPALIPLPRGEPITVIGSPPEKPAACGMLETAGKFTGSLFGRTSCVHAGCLENQVPRWYLISCRNSRLRAGCPEFRPYNPSPSTIRAPPRRSCASVFSLAHKESRPAMKGNARRLWLNDSASEYFSSDRPKSPLLKTIQTQQSVTQMQCLQPSSEFFGSE